MVGKEEFIKDREKGISLGLQYPYRCAFYGSQYIIYDFKTGRITERLQIQENETVGRVEALKRLHAINGLEMALDEEVKIEIDMQ